MHSDAPMILADHNFHAASLTPSGTLVVQIPDTPGDSWVRGKLYVSLKDAALEPSSPKRHMSELFKVLLLHYPSLEEIPPMLFAIADGGPDHNTKFWSVIASWISMFLKGNFDFLWAMRSAPSQSWLNFVERCFSLLNIALQNAALVRQVLVEAGLEEEIRGCGSLSAIRIACEKNTELKDAWLRSIHVVCTEVGEKFSRLHWSDEFVAVYLPSSPEETLSFWESVSSIDDSLAALDLKIDAKVASKCEKLQVFVKYHMHLTEFGIQIRKVHNCNCLFCEGENPVMKPIRMPLDEFSKLAEFGPDPVPRESSVVEKENFPGRIYYESFKNL